MAGTCPCDLLQGPGAGTSPVVCADLKDKEDFWRGITIVTDEGNSGKTLLNVIWAILS